MFFLIFVSLSNVLVINSGEYKKIVGVVIIIFQSQSKIEISKKRVEY